MSAVCLHRAQKLNSCPASLKQDLSFFLIRKPGDCCLISINNKNSNCHGILFRPNKHHFLRSSRRNQMIKAFWQSGDGEMKRPMANGDGDFRTWLPSCSWLAPAMALLHSVALILSCLRARMATSKEQNGKASKNMLMELVTGENHGLMQLSQHGGLGMALLTTSTIAKDHISPFIGTLKANPTFMSGLLAWAIAQVLKVFTTYFVERRWDLKMILGSGGMPSSHSALCVGLTTSVAVCHGVSDALFPVCLGFSLIVMYDATGVRRHAGMQAEVLNMIVKDLFQGHPVSEKKLKELLGHTPLQVIAGACVGMLVGYWCSSTPSRHVV